MFALLVKELLDNGIEASCMDDKKRTPLHIAAAMGTKDIGKCLWFLLWETVPCFGWCYCHNMNVCINFENPYYGLQFRLDSVYKKNL